MPHIQSPETRDRDTWTRKNGSACSLEPQRMFGHEPEQPENVLELRRSGLSQALIPFISHDIRHHLASILRNAELLSDPGILQVDRDHLLAEVRGAIHDMTYLIDSFLLSVRTQETLNLQPVSVNSLIHRAVGRVRSHPDAQRCEVVIRGAPSIEARVDTQRLGTAVYNLLLNACQALKPCSPSKRVEIALWQDESSIRIRVEENGHGVSDRIRTMLFQPFVSAEKPSGVCLGLTIAEQVAREHGGSLSLEESTLGRTNFVLELPKLAQESPMIEERSA